MSSSDAVFTATAYGSSRESCRKDALEQAAKYFDKPAGNLEVQSENGRIGPENGQIDAFQATFVIGIKRQPGRVGGI